MIDVGICKPPLRNEALSIRSRPATRAYDESATTLRRNLEISIVRTLVEEPVEMRQEVRRRQMAGSLDDRIQNFFCFQLFEDGGGRTGIGAPSEPADGFCACFRIWIGKTVE